jgi:hypothetical protein
MTFRPLLDWLGNIMSNIRITLATLVAGGIVGAAGQASAAISFVTPNIGADDSVTNIKLAGSSLAQFSYGSSSASKSYLTALNGSGIGDISNSFSLPGAGETYGDTSLKTTGLGSDFDAPAYVHLDFVASGVTYVGTATFNGADTLTRIDYEKFSDLAGGVPEPSSWALLIAGFGVAGVSLRRRRQTVSATA